MSSSRTCGCCVCPTDAVQSSGGVGGGVGWAGPAREYLESVVAWLEGPDAMVAGHGELETRLQVDSREQYRLLLQGHLDARAAREPRRKDVTDNDGQTRRRVENGHQRALETVFGLVTVTRKAYRANRTGSMTHHENENENVNGSGLVRRAAGNLYPADAVANLPPVRQSAGLARLVAIEAARGSFGGAREAVERATGVALGKRQVEGLAARAAVDVDGFYAARAAERCPDAVLGLQCDGKGIVMRPGHLRPATAKAAAKSAAKLATRLSPGEKHGRKRMAEVVAVYDLKPAPRTVEDVIPTRATTSARQDNPAARPPPAVSGKWLHANVIDDIPAVISAMFDEAERRDPDHQRTWVALIDGNNQQIDTIRDQAQARGVTLTILIDFVHVLEYLWKAAWTLYFPGDRDAEVWVADRARTILTGRAIDAAATIAQQADAAGFRGSERTGADEAVTYLTRKAPYLDYATALTNGWQIATGIIEGAARFLIKDRMDITGARWTTPGAQTILNLRAVIANGDFDTYWQYHQQQELRRNHLDHYQQLDLAA